MDDQAVAEALAEARGLEAQARAHWTASAAAEDLAEQDAALVVVRHVTALRKALEAWIGTRACRARMAHR